MTPLVRTGPKGAAEFRAVPWDEALDLVAQRIRAAVAEHGAASVIPYLYSSSAGMLGSGALGPYVVDRLGLPEVEHTICAGTTAAAWHQVFGDMLSADPLDVPHTQLLVVWGANPTVSNTHLLPLATEARKRGATLVVIDPRRTGMARARRRAPCPSSRHRRRARLRRGQPPPRARPDRRQLLCGARRRRRRVPRGRAKQWSITAAAAECGLTRS